MIREASLAGRILLMDWARDPDGGPNPLLTSLKIDGSHFSIVILKAIRVVQILGLEPALFSSLLATSCLLYLYNVMCQYTTAEIVHDECTRNPPHKIVKRLFRRCPNRPKPGPRCDNPALDPSLGTHLPSHRRGPCKFCRDSGASVGADLYEDVSRDLWLFHNGLF